MAVLKWCAVMNKKQRGFTLIEIMIALAVLAIAMVAIMRAVTADASNLTYIRDKTLAQWVGINRITELRMNNEWPATGTTSGSEYMVDKDWFWKMKVSTTADADVRKIEISVSHEKNGDDPLVTLTAFIGNST